MLVNATHSASTCPEGARRDLARCEGVIRLHTQHEVDATFQIESEVDFLVWWVKGQHRQADHQGSQRSLHRTFFIMANYSDFDAARASPTGSTLISDDCRAETSMRTLFAICSCTEVSPALVIVP